jgi:hypothetical protein
MTEDRLPLAEPLAKGDDADFCVPPPCRALAAAGLIGQRKDRNCRNRSARCRTEAVPSSPRWASSSGACAAPAAAGGGC